MAWVSSRLAIVAWVVLLAGGTLAVVDAQSMEPSASSGWVRLPAAGATSARAYAVIDNPTMDPFTIVKASADVAASVELQQTDPDAVLSEGESG